MLCDRCGDSEATIHQIHVTDNDIEHLQLCETCAKEQTSGSPQAEAGVSEAFSGVKTETDDTCPGCGLDLKELKKANKVGCQECYTTFREQFETLVHRIHGADQHVVGESESNTSGGGLGKISPEKKKKMLEKRLQQRVEEEDYERAADLRDRIENLEDEFDDGAAS